MPPKQVWCEHLCALEKNSRQNYTKPSLLKSQIFKWKNQRHKNSLVPFVEPVLWILLIPRKNNNQPHCWHFISHLSSDRMCHSIHRFNRNWRHWRHLYLFSKVSSLWNMLLYWTIVFLFGNSVSITYVVGVTWWCYFPLSGLQIFASARLTFFLSCDKSNAFDILLESAEMKDTCE